MNIIKQKRAAFRSRMGMLTSMLRNYGAGLILGAVFLPVLTGIAIPVWKEEGAIAIGLILSGLAIYLAPFGARSRNGNDLRE